MALRNRHAGERKGKLLGSVGLTLFGGLMGGSTVWFLQNWSFRLSPGNMKFEDFAAILLAVVGVVVAIFGGVLALLAFWGFSQMKKDALAAAVGEVEAQIQNGAIREMLVVEVEEMLTVKIASPEVERMLDDKMASASMQDRINRRVDEVVFGNVSDPDLDTATDQEPDESDA